MNAERLLALYEKVAEAPDAISRLRRFVLDLAIRGKLVPQDEDDEPASELLKRIASENARLVEAKAVRQPKAVPSLVSDDLPFSLPSGWAWTQIAELGVISPRNEADDDAEASFVSMPMIAADYGVANEHEPRPWGEIKKGYTHFAEGDVGLAKITPCFENGKSTVFRNLTGGIGSGTTELHIVRPLLVNADYIVLFLKSPRFIETGIPKMTGTAGQKRVPKDYFTSSPFPLPPVKEQERIVAKVEELMALLDRLEAARAEREAIRDRLSTASLTRLTAPETDPDDFPSHARFALDALPAFTARQDQIKTLRQTILDLAVRGKLVEQGPAGEPASELLKRIAAEKDSLVEAGVLKAERKPRQSSASVELFEIPSGWEWASLQSICFSISDGDHQAPPKVESGLPFLVIGDVKTKTINYDAERRVPQEYFDGLDPIRKPRAGDLLYTLVGSFGIPVPVKSDTPFCIQRHIGILRPPKHVELQLLAFFLESDFAFKQAEAAATGIAQKTVSLAGLRSLMLPLPPLAEQHGIVSKVEELMALLERLESALNGADTTRAQLLEALVFEALDSSTSNREAA